MESIKYTHPMDLASILSDRIEGLLVGIGSHFLEMSEYFYSLGATPIVYDPKKPFFIVDYGFIFFVLTEWLKEIDPITATNIENDFTKENVYLTKNGLFFLSILEYFNVSYRNRNMKTFYIKNLFYEDTKKSHFVINSIAINKSAFDQYCGEHFTERLSESCEKFSTQAVAYGVNIYRFLAQKKSAQKKPVDVINFWTNTGINKNILKNTKSFD